MLPSHGRGRVFSDLRDLRAARRIANGRYGAENPAASRLCRVEGARTPLLGDDRIWGNLTRIGGAEPAPQASRRDGGVDAGIDLRGHEPGPEDLGSALADLGFEIAREEGVKDIEGEEGDQQEALDGVGVVLEDVVGVPLVGQFVESVILSGKGLARC